MAGVPLSLSSKFGGLLLSGDNLSILDWNPNFASLNYPFAPYDCYLDQEGNLYIDQVKMNVYNTSFNNTIANNWNLSLENAVSFTTNFGSTSKAQIFSIFPDLFGNNLYIIGNFNRSKNLNEELETEIFSKSVNSNFIYNKFIKVDKSTAQPVVTNDFYLDHIGQKGFKKFSISDRDQSTSNSLDSNENVYCYHQTGNKLYLGGSFNTIGDVIRGGLAVYNKSGNLQPVDISITTFNVSQGRDINHSINSVVSTGDNLFLGGSIFTFGGRRKHENSVMIAPGALCLTRLKNPINTDRTFLPVKANEFNNQGLTQISDIKKYNNNIYAVGRFNDFVRITGDDSSLTVALNRNISNPYERTGILILDISGRLLKNKSYNLLGVNNFSSNYANTIFITGSTGYIGGNFTGLNINGSSQRKYDFMAVDLNTDTILPYNYDTPEGEVFSIQHFNQNWIESRNEFDQNAEIIEDKLNTIIVLGSFDTLYSGYAGNTTTNRWHPDPNGLLFIDANNPSIRYSGLRTGMRVIKYLSSGVISTGNNFENFNHRDIVRLKNYNLNNTFDFIYGTGINYEYSSTTYNDYGEIRFKTLNDIATYINNPNSLTVSSPPNWSNLYNNFTGILNPNSLTIRYKISGNHSGDFPFISLEHIGLGLFEKTFSISENNNITGELNPTNAITKKYIGDFCAITKTGEILVVGNSNWKNQTTNIPSGAAYIYKNQNSNFELVEILSGSGHGSQNFYSYYGFNGDINHDGSTIAIGAKNFHANRIATNIFQTTGIVDIYTGNNYNWDLQQRLSGNFSGLGTGNVAASYFSGRDFGKSLSLDYFGNRIAISDVLKRNNETGSNIHIFQKINNNRWGLENIINLSPYDIYDIKLNDYGNILALGQSTGLGGNIKIITKTGIDWSTALTGEISSENPNNQIYLGASIDMNSIGNTIVAGAPNAINNNINCGAVFVYTGMNTNWSQVAKITGNNLVAGERFGHSVSINKDATIMSIFSKNADTGKAYIFTGFASTWKQYEEITGFSGAWVGITGDYIRPDRLINKNIKINGSGNLLLIGDTLSGIVRSFSLPYQSKPNIDQFDGGYQERYITFRYPTSNRTNSDFRGYERLNDNYYYLYGDILDYNDSVNGPWINGISTSFMNSLPSYPNSGTSIILINNTGGWETGFFPLFGNYDGNNVLTAKVFKNKLYVGGDFSEVGKYEGGKTLISDLVCLDTGNANILSPFTGINLNGAVLDINIWNDHLLIVGSFNSDSIGKRNINGMIVADETGKMYTSYNFSSNQAAILKTYIDENNEIYVMGRKNSISSASSPFSPTISPRTTGVLDANFGFLYNYILPIICLNKTPSGYEIPYNEFNKNLPQIANIGNFSSPSSFENSSNSYISTIVTGESGFYIGGVFNNINGITRNNIALIGYDGSLKEWAPVFNGPIYDMVKSGNQLFVAGDFSDVNNGWNATNIVQIRCTGRANDIADINQDFDPIIDTTNESSNTKIISKIFLDSGYIYIGGTFKTVDFPSTPKVSFAAFDQAGNHVPELTQNISITNNPSFNFVAPEVRCIEKLNDIFLLGGYFDYVNGQNITDFVPIKQDGTIIPFPSGLICKGGRTYNSTSIITDIKVTGNCVYLIGPSLAWATDKTSTYGGARLGGACRLIYTGDRFIIDKNWMPAFELAQSVSNFGRYSARKMALDDQENSYIFGNFRKAGYFRPGICELENEEITNFNPLIDLENRQDFVKEIQSYDNNHIIIGGSFSSFGTTGNVSGVTGRANLAVINLNNSELHPWNGGISSNAEIRTILVDQPKNQIHVGGIFTHANSRPFDNIITLDHQSGSQVKMRPYIVNDDKGNSNIFVNSILKKDNNSLIIGGKIGNIASYVDVTGNGVLSSGTGFYNDYIPVATGTTFVSGLYTGFLTHTGLNEKNITGKFLFLSNINYASGSIFTGISGLTLTQTTNSFINNIIVSNASSGGNDNYKRLFGGYNQFSGSSQNFIRYSGDLNTWLLYTGTTFQSADALYKSDDLLTWQNYTKTWDGSVFVGYSDYYYTGFKPNDLFILSHRNSSGVWPFIFGTGANFEYGFGGFSNLAYADNQRRIRFNSLSGLNRHINETNFEGNPPYYVYNNIYKYYTGRIINDQSGQKLIITAKSTGANYPDTNLYYYGSGNPMIFQLEGETTNQYIETNLTLSSNPSLKTTKIFSPLTGVQTFSISLLTGETNRPVTNVTGLWLSTGYISGKQNFNILPSNSGYYRFTGSFTGLPISGRLLSKNDMNLVPFAPFTGYSTRSEIITGQQTSYIYSGQVYNIITENTIFSGEFETTGLISGTVTGTTLDGYIYHIVTGVPYFFDSGDVGFFSGVKLVENKNIFSGEYSNLITGFGALSGRYFYTGLTGINLTGTGIRSFISSGIITGSLQDYNPIFNQSFVREIFSSGIYENKFTGNYYEVIVTSGLNGPFYGTGFLSEGIMPDMQLYEKTFSGAFEVQTGKFLDSYLKALDPDDPYTYSTQIPVLVASDVPISINIKYKSNYDKLDLVGKLTLFSPVGGKLIREYITGVIT